MSVEQVLTCGEYVEEEDATSGLLSIINPSHWVVQPKAKGQALHPRLDVIGCGRLELDFLLTPTRLLIQHGWRWGHIGIECKRSGKKIGPVIAQAMDYTRAVWDTPSGFAVMARLVFVWPCDPPTHDIASLMVAHRVGAANVSSAGEPRLTLWFNGRVAYADKGDDPPRVANDLPGGRKQGSR